MADPTKTFEPKPLTLDQVDTYGHGGEHYGVKLAALGEEGDMGWVAFTHDRRRAIAALNRHVREDLREGRVYKITTDAPEWWLLFENCGCGEKCQHAPDGDGWIDHTCDHEGLPPCDTERFAWACERGAADAPGALPVITMEAYY